MSAAQDDDTRDGVWEPRFAPVAQIIPPNVFADMDVKVAAAVASGADVIDLAKGNPDAYPAEFIRDVAKSSVDDPLNARYTPFDGKPAFLQAAANWYRNVHGVELDWRSQLFAVEGAVDGLAGLFAILIDRGDAVAFADSAQMECPFDKQKLQSPPYLRHPSPAPTCQATANCLTCRNSVWPMTASSRRRASSPAAWWEITCGSPQMSKK